MGIFISTGKRRYGHPALNGVLPEPWLPLKKGQSLVNNDPSRGTRTTNDPNAAVVLTLRNRVSLVRRASRHIEASPAQSSVGLDGVAADDTASNPIVANPWDDTSLVVPRRSRTTSVLLNHRISFDGASGVINLPDDGDWLVEDIDSDEEDYGISAADVTSSPIDVGPSSPPKRRYGTYYHHPERRRQSIPGAFPRS
jgi:calcium permeable stress-gated cation channel